MKKKIALLLACAALALTACGSSEPTATTAADVSEAESEETAEAETTAAESSEAETESSEAAKEFAEKGKELLNNDLVTVTLGEPIDEDYYIGYSATIENKSSDKYVLVSIDNGSVDGLMTYISLQGGSVRCSWQKIKCRTAYLYGGSGYQDLRRAQKRRRSLQYLYQHRWWKQL